MATVVLVGELEDSGFAERHYLVKRDGQFVQLSELLYRITELADGTRTAGQIAREVTESTEWQVSGAQVRELIDRRLTPLGLIRGEDAPQPQAQPPAPRAHPSPVTLKLRAKVLGPAMIEPITAILRALYWPPVLLGALALIGAGHAWLYLGGGLAEAFVALIYAPALMSLIVPVVLIAGAFHEFGHAAALRYGGGHVRAMGVGLYVIWPVLYTDVTDSYRLGRWARLRTGLGGVYFHLVFAAALIALFALTRQPVFAVVVLLINLEAVRQLLPLLRLDGYWILADLTGIPDPLTQLMTHMRSRTGALTGRRHVAPSLRSWVRRVFAIYAVVTAIVMLGLIVLLVARLPWLLGHIWVSGGRQIGEVASAWQRADVPGLLGGLAGIAFLALPLVGLSYFFWTIGRLAAPPLWRATRRSRAVAVGLGTAAVALTVVGALVWMFSSRDASIAGVEAYAVDSRQHTDGDVTYQRSPPVGGDHASVWQNCGFYASPVPDEQAVHSMEHGAVWITYDPAIGGSEIDRLRQIAVEHRYVLASPYEDLTEPVVASAWGFQLKLDSASDERLKEFVATFAGGPQAPEPGAPCHGGGGAPEETAPA